MILIKCCLISIRTTTFGQRNNEKQKEPGYAGFFYYNCLPSVKLNVKSKTIDLSNGFLSYNYGIFILL
jgi:hypothetical protein